jgi:hypothetical protein
MIDEDRSKKQLCNIVLYILRSHVLQLSCIIYRIAKFIFLCERWVLTADTMTETVFQDMACAVWYGVPTFKKNLLPQSPAGQTQWVPLKCRYMSITGHGVTSQKTVLCHFYQRVGVAVTLKCFVLLTSGLKRSCTTVISKIAITCSEYKAYFGGPTAELWYSAALHGTKFRSSRMATEWSKIT